MLRKFSENAGIALENARLYKTLKDAKENLSEAYENLIVLNKMKDEFLTVASRTKNPYDYCQKLSLDVGTTESRKLKKNN